MGRLDESQVIPWILQVCEALAYLHNQNPPIIHRDIKPKNIIITPQGSAVLVDFGIAKEYIPGVQTTIGARAVTPGYSPVEQYGQGRTDARTDIYALGATLYSLLTGVRPDEATQRAGHDMLVPAEQINPAIRSSTATAIRRAMQVGANSRFQSAQGFVAALQARGYQPPPAVVTVSAAAPIAADFVPPARAQPIAAPELHSGFNRLVILAGAIILVILLLAIWLVKRDSTEIIPSDADRTATAIVAALLKEQTSLTPIFTLPVTFTSPPPEMPTTPPAIETLPTFEIPTDTPYPTAGPQAGEISYGPIDGAERAYIPAGEFIMGLTQSQANYLFSLCTTSGCTRSTFDASVPVHTVYLDSFWMDRYEVSNGRYSACVSAGACKAPRKSSSSTRSDYFTNAQYDNYPVVYVDWYDAESFCSWAGGRLPTEAEWEKAARGTDGRMFPWGNSEPNPSLANVHKFLSDTAPVGEYPQGESPYRIRNLAGNVWEWVYDWYDPAHYYSQSSWNNPRGPGSSPQGYRVGRGGSFVWSPGAAGSGMRDWYGPGDDGYGVGFRCAYDR